MICPSVLIINIIYKSFNSINAELSRILIYLKHDNIY